MTWGRALAGMRGNGNGKPTSLWRVPGTDRKELSAVNEVSLVPGAALVPRRGVGEWWEVLGLMPSRAAGEKLSLAFTSVAEIGVGRGYMVAFPSRSWSTSEGVRETVTLTPDSAS